MSQEDLHQIELGIDTAKKMVKEAESIDRLFKNRDFKAIITEGYFKEFAAVLVQRKALPAMQTETEQKSIDNAITGIGELQQFLFTKRMQGKQVAKELNEMESVRDELLQEDATEE
jgi:hypothetical protein